ncbi:MAG TPA: carbon storage regulator CsrA [Nitrospira sp.]
MLVLSRKKNEAVVINHEITVVIVEIRGDKVRLGIEAPAHIAIHRQEVEAKVLAEMDAAKQNAPQDIDWDK